MPPPTAGDPWLAGRRFGIVIDAGSSGSRIQVYSWTDPVILLAAHGDAVASTLPKVEKGTKIGDGWVHKVEPGISSFGENPGDVGSYLNPLLTHARDVVPPSLQAETPIFLLATAGMRLLPPEQQASILLHTCQYFVQHSHFRIEPPSASGPCGSSVRIITGEEEGLFGWIAVNYLMDGFTSKDASARTTYGFLDMGGASTQIAFEPSEDSNSDNLIDVRLRLLNGEEIHHKVFVTTWLGYGTNQARERYVGQAIEEFEASRSQVEDEVNDIVPDPCLPKDLTLTETPLHLGPASSEHATKSHTLTGTGSFEKCMKKTSALLNKSMPCPDVPCLMNGIHVPPIDFNVSHFIGVSEYWFSSEHVFGLGGVYDFVQYELAASKFCAREWQGIIEEHEQARSKHTGDGEVLKDGEVVEVGKWGPQVELPRLQMQCFKAAWIVNVLHEGLGMPRIVDPGGNTVEDGGDEVVKQAESKGLGRPTFQSVDTVGDIAISWTLGKMVLEASKDIPIPLNSHSEPLTDPLDEAPNFPIQPIRPPFLDIDAIEDKISAHLPASLKRDSLGFSPVLLILYVLVLITLFLIIYPLRRSLRTFFLRALRRASPKRGSTESYMMMEEGKPLTTGYSRPPSPASSSNSARSWLKPLRRIFSFPRHLHHAANGRNINHRPPPIGISISTSSPTLRPSSTPTSASRISPPWSYSLPGAGNSGGGSLNGAIEYGFGAASASSRSPSPSPGFEGFTARSRNASQSSLAPRSGAISRVGSMRTLASEDGSDA